MLLCMDEQNFSRIVAISSSLKNLIGKKDKNTLYWFAKIFCAVQKKKFLRRIAAVNSDHAEHII